MISPCGTEVGGRTLAIPGSLHLDALVSVFISSLYGGGHLGWVSKWAELDHQPALVTQGLHMLLGCTLAVHRQAKQM